MKISVYILFIVFLLIAVRRIGRIRLQIWQIMLLGAVGVLVTGEIGPIQALKAIDMDVMLFLFGMFVVGQAMDESGYLSQLAYRAFRHARSLDALVLSVLFVMGMGSAFLMNDTFAIIGTPVMLHLARRHGVSAKLMLLSLAFAVTIGSVLSPIGNPQNLLIAINGNVPNPFVTFLKFLFVPTVINIFVAYGFLKLFYRREFHSQREICHEEEALGDRALVRICQVSLFLLVVLIVTKIVLVLLRVRFDFRLTYIALASAFPILALSRRRYGIVKRIDWHTLIFFAAMFVLMQSVWESGFFQGIVARLKIEIARVEAVLGISVILSQFISNVPLVALYLPLLMRSGAGTMELMALAAGSTIAGNLFILGAASNVIIIQNAEKKAGETLTFFEFARVGAPLTIVNVAVYWLFLKLM